jgi:hypothetical protein
MNPSGKVTAAFMLVILAIGGAFGAYYLNTSSMLTSREQTISGLQSTVSSLLSHPVTSTVTTVVTQTETAISVRTTATIATSTITRFPNVPWDSVDFMEPPDQGNRTGGNGPFLWGGNFSDALLFDCTSSPTQGCTEQVCNGLVRTNFSITAQYPLVNQVNEPAWANCAFASYELPSGQPAAAGQGFAYCIPIGSSAFIVARQGFPPA